MACVNETFQDPYFAVVAKYAMDSGIHREATASRRSQGIAMMSIVLSPTASGQRTMNQPLVDQKQWLERHRPYLTLLARAHLRRHHPARLDSSDIVQQTLLNAFSKRDHFRGSSEAEFAAWLREILKHNLADALRDQRRDKRDVRRDRSLEAEIDESFSRTHGWLAAAQSSPSQKVIKQEDLRRLSEALTLLPEAQREVIVLHHLQGLKLAEVAAEIDRTEAAVAGLLFRGLRALHAILAE